MAQIPFIKWLGTVPVAGSSLQKVVGSAAKPVTPLMFGVSGRQFFLADGSDGREPVLVSEPNKICIVPGPDLDLDPDPDPLLAAADPCASVAPQQPPLAASLESHYLRAFCKYCSNASRQPTAR